MYVGKIRGYDRTYRGEHQPLMSRDVWDEAQAVSKERKKRPPDKSPSPLSRTYTALKPVRYVR